MIIEKKCPFCDDLFYKLSHVVKCPKNNGITDLDELRYLIIKYNNNNVPTKEDLEHFYILELKSIVEISNIYNCAYTYIEFLIEYFNIKKRNIKDACNNPNRQVKNKMTLRGRYGVTNMSQIESVKEKKRQICMRDYGVDNNFKVFGFNEYVTEYMLTTYGVKRITPTPEYISNARKQFTSEKWDEIKSKYTKTCLLKYGVENGGCLCKPVSKIELFVGQLLLNFGVSFTKQFELKEGKKNFYYDFLLNDYNIIIEVNGDFWHANPALYKNDDTINYPGKGEIEASEIWERDIKKQTIAEKHGYVVIYLWETDIKKCSTEQELVELLNIKLYDLQIKIDKKN